MVVLGGAVANPTEPTPSRRVEGEQHLVDRVAERHVGVTDDRGDLGAVGTGAFLGERRDELDFADRPQVLGPVRAVLGMAFEEHGPHHVVTRARVTVQVGECVRPPGVPRIKPQVMMRIADRQVWLERIFVDLGDPRPMLIHGTVVGSHATSMSDEVSRPRVTSSGRRRDARPRSHASARSKC